MKRQAKPVIGRIPKRFFLREFKNLPKEKKAKMMKNIAIKTIEVYETAGKMCRELDSLREKIWEIAYSGISSTLKSETAWQKVKEAQAKLKELAQTRQELRGKTYSVNLQTGRIFKDFDIKRSGGHKSKNPIEAIAHKTRRSLGHFDTFYSNAEKGIEMAIKTARFLKKHERP